jgi:hypothetical protein
MEGAMKGIAGFTFGLVLTTVFFAAPASAVSITNIDFIPTSPANLDFGEDVFFTFDYELDEESHIFGRPFEGGALRLDYAAHPSPFYAAGTGSGTGFFTILDLGQGIAHVDQVRFQIFATDDFALLHEQFVSVDYTFGRASTPEPAALLMLCTGLLGIAECRRRRGISIE